ncbi:MAG: peptidylprolyl isomerase [Saprospirales bacterium]|nr:peptidylprolyl isomerase [Saprospirales bacterium]
MVEQACFDDLIFHRVISGFMIQGGIPNSRNAKPGQSLGSGGPGYTIPAEFVDSSSTKKSALAAARTGDQVNPEKKSSRLPSSISYRSRATTEEDLNMIEAGRASGIPDSARNIPVKWAERFLVPNYTVFGEVVEGDVIDKIGAVTTQPGDRPKTDIKMKIKPMEITPQNDGRPYPCLA